MLCSYFKYFHSYLNLSFYVVSFLIVFCILNVISYLIMSYYFLFLYFYLLYIIIYIFLFGIFVGFKAQGLLGLFFSLPITRPKQARWAYTAFGPVNSHWPNGQLHFFAQGLRSASPPPWPFSYAKFACFSSFHAKPSTRQTP